MALIDPGIRILFSHFKGGKISEDKLLPICFPSLESDPQKFSILTNQFCEDGMKIKILTVPNNSYRF